MSFSIWKRILSAKYGVAVSLSLLLQGIVMAVIYPLLPIVLSERIGLDKNEVTAFYLINTLFGIVIALGSGYLSDGVVSRYKLVLVSGIVGTLAYLGIATATQPLYAIIAGAFTATQMVLFPQLFAVAKTGIVGDWEPESQVIGLTALRTLFSFGYILGTAVSSWIAQTLEIQSAFFAISAAILAMTLYTTYILYRIEGHITARGVVASAERSDKPSAPVKPISLPIYALVLPLLALIILRGADSTRGVYLSLVMFQMFNDASIAPLMFGITAAAELITLGLLGYIASRIGEKATISIGSLVGAFCFVMLSFSDTLPILYLSQLLYAVFVAALLGVAMTYVQSLLSHRVGMGGSLYMAVLNVGTLIGILTPLLTEGYSQQVFIVPAILCVAGAALLMFGDRTAQISQRLRDAAEQEESHTAPILSGVPPVALEHDR